MTFVTKPFETIETIEERTHADRMAQTIALFETHGLKACDISRDAIEHYLRKGQSPLEIVNAALRPNRPRPFA